MQKEKSEDKVTTEDKDFKQGFKEAHEGKGTPLEDIEFLK